MYQHHPKRRKKRPIHGVKTVEVSRGKSGYGFTISGQHPCVLSCIISNSPAENVGLKPGDYLATVNGLDVSKLGHDEVVRMVGLSTGTLTLQVSENYNSSDSSDDEYPPRTKSKYPNRVRTRNKYSEKMDKILSDINHRDRHCPDGHSHDPTSRPMVKPAIPRSRTSRPRLHMPVGAENPKAYTEGRHSQDEYVNGAFKVPMKKSTSASVVPSAGASARAHIEPKQAFIKSTSQRLVRSGGASSSQPSSRVPNPHNYSNFSPTSLQQIINHSLHSYSAANEAFIMNDEYYDVEEEEDEEPLQRGGDQLIRVVVGYIGSLEMPGDANQPHVRIQSIRNAVRRLRVEQKIHTLVLMTVSDNGVRLTNMMGAHVANYSVERLAFSGVCPDDRRFFGIVTLHSSSSDEVSSDSSSVEELASSSCHVFMVDPEMTAHSVHIQKARSLGIDCTVDPQTQRCLEFPRSTTPIILSITNLYKDRPGGTVESDVARSQVFANPNRPAERSSSNSSNSNSDSGLGLGRDEAVADVGVELPPPLQDRERDAERDRPQPRQLPTIQWSGNTIHLTDGPMRRRSPDTHPASARNHGKSPKSRSKQDLTGSRGPPLDTSTSSEEYFRASDKLNVRAMPNPANTSRSSGDGLENQNAAENLRQSMQKLLQARQKHGPQDQTSSDTESRSSRSDGFSSSSKLQERPVSAPFRYLSNESNTSVENRSASSNNLVVETVDLADKLSPRAFLSSAFTPVGSTGSAFKKVRSQINTLRSPSAPPIPSYHADMDSDEDGVEKLIDKFEQERMLWGSPSGLEQLKTHGGHHLKRDQDRKGPSINVTPTVSSSNEKWTKPHSGSLRQRGMGRRNNPLSLSHESLVALDQDPLPSRLSSANSVNSIVNQVAKTIKQEEVGRVAGWAVNFDKLLKDGIGITIFTDFLKKEFSEENVTFWKTCQDYKAITDTAFRKSKAKEIYNQYVSVRASDAVNIDSVARKQVESNLDSPTPKTFDVPQMQIFQLMRQDSYARFLKSDLYKLHLLAEMEGRPLYNSPAVLSKQEDKEDPTGEKDGKKKGNGKENEDKPKDKRRRSLLPWRQKSSKNNIKSSDAEVKKAKTSKDKEKDAEVNNNMQKNKSTSSTSSSTAVVVVENARKESKVDLPDTIEEEEAEQPKFCRVIMPDGSTTVVGAKQGHTINYILGKLCEKRGLSIASVDVFLLGSDKPLNLSEDISSLGGKEVTIERRVLFRMDLPNKKSIGVKAKPNRVIRDVFKPILNKYGFRIDAINVHLGGHEESLDLEGLVSSIDSQRVIVEIQPLILDDSPAWTGNYITATRPPLPNKLHHSSNHRNTVNMGQTLEEITNQIYGDLMQGKSDEAHNFDELGILDPDKTPKKEEEPPSSGFFGLLRRESGAVKELKAKVKPKVTFALQKNQVKSHPNDEEEKILCERLRRAQCLRFDDQRGLAPHTVDLPEFLCMEQTDELSKESSIPVTGRESAPPTLGRDGRRSPPPSYSNNLISEIDDYIANINENFAAYTRDSNNARMSADSVLSGQKGTPSRERFNSFGKVVESPGERINATDQSFSEDGVIPSFTDAEDLFQTSNQTADFDDPNMTNKSLTDIGFGYGYNKYLAKSRNFVSHRARTNLLNPMFVQPDPSSFLSPDRRYSSSDSNHDHSDSLDTTLTHTPRSSPSLSDSSYDKENHDKYTSKQNVDRHKRLSRHTLIHSPIKTEDSVHSLSAVDTDGLMIHSTPKVTVTLPAVNNAVSSPKVFGSLQSKSALSDLSQSETSVTFV